MLPRASRRTFTLRELARLLTAVQPSDLSAVAALQLDDTAGRFAELVDIAAALRGYVPPPAHEIDDDVVDPYRRGDDVYAEMGSQLIPAVDVIVQRLELASTITPDRV
jgi:protein-tyrosine phosphatase